MARGDAGPVRLLHGSYLQDWMSNVDDRSWSRDGITTTAATGVANSSGDPLTPQTPFRIMSITKTFVATMMLQLVDEGRVNLDQPLSIYLPDPALGGDVPVRLLLNHRSGLPDYVSHASYTDFTAAVLADRERAFTPEEVLGYVADARAGTPDRFFRYSNTNYILLGQLIEHIDGTDLATSLQTRITNPLDLRATVLPTADQPAPDHLAAGWSTDGLDGDPSIPFDSIESAAWAAGGMISTADDLAHFVTALFDGQLISDAMLAEMTDLGAQHYGLGITTADFGSGAAGYFGAGSGFGFGSIMGIYPDTGDVVVVLTNNSAVDVHEIAGHIVGQW